MTTAVSAILARRRHRGTQEGRVLPPAAHSTRITGCTQVRQFQATHTPSR